MMMMPVPPVAHVGLGLLAAERRLVARLREAHATVPERAVAMNDLRRVESGRLARLARAGAVHEVGPGRWYLDEPVYAEYRDYRRRIAAITLIAALLAGVAVYLVFGV
jgi:hypothetical protein